MPAERSLLEGGSITLSTCGPAMAASPSSGNCPDPARRKRPQPGPAVWFPACHYGGMVDPRAGQPAARADLVNVAKLVTAYYAVHPDPGDPAQRVSFGTSGHRGSSFTATFNEDHILATTQAICEYRASQGIDGPLYLGADTHALSEPAQVSALEVLAANGVRVMLDARGGGKPTPAGSPAALAPNAS